jgi:serine/threonine protein kinase
MSSVSSKLSHASNGTLQRQIPHSRIDDEEIIYRKYELMELLGRGSFGTVYKIISKETNQKYAIKIINKERVIIKHSNLN